MKKTSVSRRDFVRMTGLGVAAGMIGFPAIVRSAASASAVPQSRLDRLTTGANVCRWFRFIKESDDHFTKYMPEAEAAYMRQIGLKHARLCVEPKVLMDQTTGAVREQNAKYLEMAIERLQKAGLLVLVDLHNEVRDAELNPAWQEAFVRFWSDLSARLKRFDPEMTMFEIINEPVFGGHESDWNPLNARLAAAIRKSAPEHTIMTSGVNWGGIDGLRKLKLLDDPNVIYSFHCYDPFTFTHQGATWSGDDVKPLRGVPYPSSPEAVEPVLAALEAHPNSRKMVESYGKARWNKDKLAARFKEGIEWGAANKVALYCGEFGVFPPYSKPEHRANWFRDFGQVLAENRIGWAVWGWDEGFGLSRRRVEGKPVVDSVVAKALGLNA